MSSAYFLLFSLKPKDFPLCFLWASNLLLGFLPKLVLNCFMISRLDKLWQNPAHRRVLFFFVAGPPHCHSIWSRLQARRWGARPGRGGEEGTPAPRPTVSGCSVLSQDFGGCLSNTLGAVSSLGEHYSKAGDSGPCRKCVTSLLENRLNLIESSGMRHMNDVTPTVSLIIVLFSHSVSRGLSEFRKSI